MGGFFHTHWSDATRIDALFGFVADAVAVCSEGGCGGMCWPVDRPATHAAAGAAARGVRGGLGDSFTRSGVDGTRGLVFIFSLRVAPVSEGILSHAQRRRHEAFF